MIAAKLIRMGAGVFTPAYGHAITPST
jgi:hypothetical protein